MSINYVDVTLDNDLLCFSDGFSRLATETEKQYFKLRKKLIAAKTESEYKIVRWADIHGHTGYSFLDGAVLPEVKAEKTEFVSAITDHGNMCGALKFYKAMIKLGKQPIIGEEFYCESIDGEKDKNHLILLAKNEDGYKNLVSLSSLSWKNEHSKPHINYEMLSKYKDNLICTTACLGGELPKAIANNLNKSGKIKSLDSARRILGKLKEIFKDDLYIEIQRHGIDVEKQVNYYLSKLATEFNVKRVVATDSHYVDVQDKTAHDVLLCISTKDKLSNKNHFSLEGSGYHIHTADEIENIFSDMPDAIDNTLEIAKKCSDFKITQGIYYLPEFPIPAPFTDEFSYLYHLGVEGFKFRFEKLFLAKKSDTEEIIQLKANKKKEYWQRFKYEMSVIKKMGFAGYFLIVKDFLDYCRNNDIPLGHGRGSGAGSLVLYCLRITDVNPIKYGLLFERFLNPDRISMPDIDSDVSQVKRHKVLEYLKGKYGVENVSNIIAFGTLSAKAVITTVVKVFGFSQADSLQISKMIPEEPNMTLKKAIEKSPEFAEWCSKNKRIFEIAKKLEGLPRNVGTHACGICIAKRPIVEFLPEMIAIDSNTKEHFVTTQFDKEEVEECGLLKIDVLGLRTLDVIDSALRIINSKHNLNITSDKIPINDSKVYSFLSQAHTDGVFQFESSGMKDLLAKMYQGVTGNETKKRASDYFDWLYAATALYRPGPLEEIPNYIKGKNGNVKYDHPSLEPILKDTFGIFVYQEQVMRAVRDLAGFSAGQSDVVRKGMAKKKESVLREYGEYFVHGSKEHNIEGCKKVGMTEADAKKLWAKMEKFGEYAFNKSHAVAYTMLSAKTAWLSYYYPVEFYTAVLNSFLGNHDKLSEYLFSCKARGIEILPPDINYSSSEFVVEDFEKKQIRFGMSPVKSVRSKFALRTKEIRDNCGLYQNLEDFIRKMGDDMDFGSFKALACAGAFGFAGYTRQTLCDSIELLKEYAKILKSYSEDYSEDLTEMFGKPNIKLKLRNKPEYSFEELARLEYEYIGLLLVLPRKCYKEAILTHNIPSLRKIQNNKNLPTNSLAMGVVLNKTIKSYVSKKTNDTVQYLTFVLDDGTNTLNCTCFNNVKEMSIKISNGSVIKVFGFVKKGDFGISINVSDIEILHEDKNAK